MPRGISEIVGITPEVQTRESQERNQSHFPYKEITNGLGRAFVEIANEHGYLTSSQFAEKSGLSVQYVWKLCREGKISAYRFLRWWAIPNQEEYKPKKFKIPR